MIAVLNYGIGNLRSAEKGIQRCGADARLVSNARDAKHATGIVLPGVGAFGACMNALRDSGLDKAVYDSIDRCVPFLGICVGLQMLFDSSEESPSVKGLGIISGKVRKIAGTMKLPQMQWNQLSICRPSPLLESDVERSWFYFAHSYSAMPEDPSVISATCDYGGLVTAVVQSDRLFATQFHPEKSSDNGLRVLSNFVAFAEHVA